MSRKKILLFDIDGTLIFSGGAGSKGMREALNETFSVDADLSEIRFAGRTDRSIVRDAFRMHSIPMNEDNWTRFIACYIELLPKHLDHCEGKVLIGVVELIERLVTHKDCRLGLLTGNIEPAAEIKLRYYGLWEYFEFGGFGDLHPERNDVARSAVESVGEEVDPKDVWILGDTPNDIACARAVDANVIAIATGGYSEDQLEEHGPDALLPDLSDSQGVLELLALSDHR